MLTFRSSCAIFIYVVNTLPRQSENELKQVEGKEIMKKLIALLLAGCMMATMVVGCGAKEEPAEAPAAAEETVEADRSCREETV